MHMTIPLQSCKHTHDLVARAVVEGGIGGWRQGLAFLCLQLRPQPRPPHPLERTVIH